ncbi:MAG: hypothetical protein H5T59_06260 [Anaerolineae bacterium]|nr:hypothetical protein [Anaerolineae bacterium]
MRLSKMPFRTLRETPAGVDLPGYAFLLRGRFLEERPEVGTWWLPWGWEVLGRLGDLARRELAALGAVEVGRRGEGNHEAPWEGLALLARTEVRSYRQLPAILYTVEEGSPSLPEAGGKGLFGEGARRGVWLVAALAGDEERARFVDALREAWGRLVAGLGLTGEWVQALGQRGPAWALAWGHPAGSEEVARCAACGHAAERAAATVRWEMADEAMQPVEPVATPGVTSIADLAAFLQLPPSRTLKVVFYTLEEGKVLCLAVRGDRTVDEAKVRHLVGRRALRPSTEDELASVGAVPGYGSPVGLQGAVVWADRSAMGARNLVAGANREGFHLRHVNPGRDFRPDRVVEVTRVEEGDPCPHCGAGLRLSQAVELARVEAPEGDGGTYLTPEGKERRWAAVHACLRVEVVLGAVAEHHHDGDGLLWPAPVAPADIYLLTLGGARAAEAERTADDLYRRLRAAGWRVLYDDRPERAGVKFKDADLVGAPVRVTVAQRGLEAGGVEVKWRGAQEARIVPLEGLEDHLAAGLRASPEHLT